MTFALLAVLIVPLGIALQALVGHADGIVALVKALPGMHLPAAPEWVSRVPLVGERAFAAWNELARAGLPELLARVEPYAKTLLAWIAQQAGGAAFVIVQFLLIVVLSAVLYADGEAWGNWVRRFGRKLASDQGDRMVVLAGQAIRGVALGVVVTALAQSALGGIGLAIAGVPLAGVLTALMFALCIAQIGPLLVLLGATAWAFHSLGTGWGVFLLVWSAVVGTMDNFLRPILIRRGANLPLMLIFAGVIGGLVAFGIVGIFVGPVILAVAYTLIDDWVSQDTAGGPVPTAGSET
jgi:predicted PurR-regulated permease PerM